jgi:hypothetical protein
VAVRPYTINIEPAVLDDMRDGIGGTRWPDQIGEPWQYGTDLDYLHTLLDRWGDGYDWPSQQDRLNTCQNLLVDTDGETVHVVHQRAAGLASGADRPAVVLLLHGWPSSFVQSSPSCRCSPIQPRTGEPVGRVYYDEAAHSASAAWGRVETPTGMAMPGTDMFPTPRAWAERQYNVVCWTDLPRGGHFLEWEVPHLIADDLHAFLRALR